jgi:hypothetical protein
VLVQPGRALRETLLFMGLYTFFIHNLSYPWDVVELLSLTLFMYLILAEQPSWPFALLAVASMANKETAVFIGLYLILVPVMYFTQLLLSGSAAKASA